jgi:hypothetical protein
VDQKAGEKSSVTVNDTMLLQLGSRKGFNRPQERTALDRISWTSSFRTKLTFTRGLPYCLRINVKSLVDYHKRFQALWRQRWINDDQVTASAWAFTILLLKVGARVA